MVVVGAVGVVVVEARADPAPLGDGPPPGWDGAPQAARIRVTQQTEAASAANLELGTPALSSTRRAQDDGQAAGVGGWMTDAVSSIVPGCRTVIDVHW